MIRLAAAFGVRVRFAPSPTGKLHLGSLRTALYNYLFAKKNKGSFVLRIEDTDQKRNIAGSADSIQDALLWCGLNWDEGPQKGGQHGPYFQSERIDIYSKYAKKLLQEGKAYKCYCGQSQGRRECICGELPERTGEGGKMFRTMLRVSKQKVQFKDKIYGRIELHPSADFAILKENGWPLYVFSNVIDDHLMRISHVIRGEEFITVMPKQLALYKALGLQPPQFAHLPLLSDESTAKKLSKRKEHSSVEHFREKGVCAEALINYVAFLGFSPFSQVQSIKEEMMTLGDLVDKFELQRVSRSPVKIDISKLLNFNRQYWLKFLNHKSKTSHEADRFKALLLAVLKQHAPLIQALDQDKLLVLREVATRYPFDLRQLECFFVKPSVQGQFSLKGKLSQLLQPKWHSLQEVGLRLGQFAKKGGVSQQQLYGQLRHLLTGSKEGPSVIQIAYVLGWEEVLSRLK